jgi:hypothetical protein
VLGRFSTGDFVTWGDVGNRGIKEDSIVVFDDTQRLSDRRLGDSRGKLRVVCAAESRLGCSTRREVAASRRAQGRGGSGEAGEDDRGHQRASAIAHRYVGGDRSGVGEDRAGVGMGFTVRRGKIVEIDVLADPVRLRQLDLAVLDD